MKTAIWVTFQVEGIHQWKDATSYLRYPHRHMFHFRVELSVSHDDREVEFIALKDTLLNMVSNRLLPKWSVKKSCEMLAKEVIVWMQAEYGDRDYVVEVSEDGENGAKVSSDCCTCR